MVERVRQKPGLLPPPRRQRPIRVPLPPAGGVPVALSVPRKQELRHAANKDACLFCRRGGRTGDGSGAAAELGGDDRRPRYSRYAPDGACAETAPTPIFRQPALRMFALCPGLFIHAPTTCFAVVPGAAQYRFSPAVQDV